MHHAGIVTAAAGCDRRRSRRKGGFRDPAGRARRQVCGPCGTDRSLRQRLQGQRFSRIARFAREVEFVAGRSGLIAGKPRSYRRIGLLLL
ncbi:hypothetical protein C4K09_3596 [Pseudomonas chlororaphis subsp. aureofaciens]|nr:hypothetical protein C4K19_3773 [Pseudomonas chlororaphis subsp. aurantiaca]AZE18054.1 hypothetical protein C4K09_3596 [Pseudomonas chlororaphis subsp. aureofaciens]